MGERLLLPDRYKGQQIDDMTVEELRTALKETGRLYRELLDSTTERRPGLLGA
jgi:hypothetical protein